jgi:hypothetical protein
MDEKQPKVKLANLSTEIANIVAARLIKQTANLDALVDEFIGKHIKGIIAAGLGISERWSHGAKLNQVNGFAGTLCLCEYISKRAQAQARKLAGPALDELLANGKSVFYKRSLRKDMEQYYVEIYERTLAEMAREHITKNADVFKHEINKAVDEIETRIDILLKPHLQRVVDELDRESEDDR